MLRRTGPIRKKSRKAKVGKYTGRVRLDAEGMKELRITVYERARGLCEMKLKGAGCQVYAGWVSGELAHYPKSRGAGAGDTPEETVWACKPCHRYQHNPKPCPPKPKAERQMREDS